MKKISRKLLLSILSMAFAVVALGTTTFAWFTTNATVTATTTIKVLSSTDSIQISDDCFSWGSTVDFDFSSTELNAATYVQGTAGTLSSDDDLVDMSGNEVNAGTNYKQAVMYVKVTSAAKNITVDTDTTASTDPTAYTLTKGFTFNNYAGTSVSYNAGDKAVISALNALRGTVDVTNAVSTAAGTEMAQADKTGAVDAFEAKVTANTRAQMIAGYTTGTTTYTGTASASTVYNMGQSLAASNCANAYIEAVLGTDFSGGTYEADTNYVTSNGSLLSADGFQGETLVTNTTAYSIYRFTFTYWLEGYDADCFDAIFAQTLTQTLTFKTSDYTA
ncbi:MAG: hypothetical protein K6G48_03755 [Acholeplasmatales bacterium]|nr:hypothetical protein [Acholeplasmatales bacterium]